MWYKTILQFFFPPRCVSCGTEGVLLCGHCSTLLPKVPHLVAPDLWALAPYHHPVVERLVRAMKYEGKRALADTVGTIISGALPSILGNEMENVVIVSVPSSQRELTGRGYDHVALIAQSLSMRGNIPFIQALEKIRETPRQVSVRNRAERLKNLVGAFRQKEDGLVGKIVLLVDDVTTTGATFMEARRALVHSGAKKTLCLAIAH